MRLLRATLIVCALAGGCQSQDDDHMAGGDSNQQDEATLTPLSSGTTSGYSWTFALVESDDELCVGFSEDEAMVGGTVCDGGRFPADAPVLEYVATVAPGVDRLGVGFLATDAAAELVVTFADGTRETRPFLPVKGRDPLTVAALVTPECGTLATVAVKSTSGSDLYRVEGLDGAPMCGEHQLLADG
jgi:hypothetical protein